MAFKLLRNFLVKKKRQHHYARINQDGVCISIWGFDEPLVHAEIIPIDSLDMMLIGRKWDNNKWV
jgi:hypothetical protein